MAEIPDGASERELLEQAEDALHSVSMRLLGVSPQLKTPHTDMPEQSPWTMTIGPQARRCHDLAIAIRKHLGLPFRYASRALGTPPLEIEDVVTQAVAAERERIRMALLGCANCGVLHERRGPLHDHRYRPRYLASPNVADLIREQS